MLPFINLNKYIIEDLSTYKLKYDLKKKASKKINCNKYGFALNLDKWRVLFKIKHKCDFGIFIFKNDGNFYAKVYIEKSKILLIEPSTSMDYMHYLVCYLPSINNSKEKVKITMYYNTELSSIWYRCYQKFVYKYF